MIHYLSGSALDGPVHTILLVLVGLVVALSAAFLVARAIKNRK